MRIRAVDRTQCDPDRLRIRHGRNHIRHPREQSILPSSVCSLNGHIVVHVQEGYQHLSRDRHVLALHRKDSYHLCAMKALTRLLGMAGSRGFHRLRTYYYSFSQASYAHILGIFSHQHSPSQAIMLSMFYLVRSFNSAAACHTQLTVLHLQLYSTKRQSLGRFERSEFIVNKLMRLTVETGLACALTALLELAFFLGLSQTNVHIAL